MPGVGEYCSASFSSDCVNDSCAPLDVENDKAVMGNVVGLGIPPPRLIMPGVLSNGIKARIGDGWRRLLNSDRNGT
jgi:hypothetical protein